jgi:hypothetical protein
MNELERLQKAASVLGGRGILAPGREALAAMPVALRLGVANWLTTAAADLWAHGPLCCPTGCMECADALWMPHVRDALTVADAALAVGAS